MDDERQTMVKMHSPHTGCVAEIRYRHVAVVAVASKKILIGSNQLCRASGVRADRGRSNAGAASWLVTAAGSSGPRRYSIISTWAFVPPNRTSSPSNRRPRIIGPGFQEVGTRNCSSSKGMLGFGEKVQVRRNRAVFQRQSGLDEASDACRSFQVSNIGLDRSDDAVRPLGRPEESTLPRALASIGSPIAVPVPCVST